MEIAAKPLIQSQKLADAESREQKWHGQSDRIGCEQQHPSGDGVASGGKSKHGRQDWSDARRPAKREGEAQQEAAPNAWLRTFIVEANVAIQPSPHDGSEETDQSERKEVNGAEISEYWGAPQRRDKTKADEQHTEDDAGARTQFRQPAKQVQA